MTPSQNLCGQVCQAQSHHGLTKKEKAVGAGVGGGGEVRMEEIGGAVGERKEEEIEYLLCAIFFNLKI